MGRTWRRVKATVAEWAKEPSLHDDATPHKELKVARCVFPKHVRVVHHGDGDQSRQLANLPSCCRPVMQAFSDQRRGHARRYGKYKLKEEGRTEKKSWRREGWFDGEDKEEMEKEENQKDHYSMGC